MEFYIKNSLLIFLSILITATCVGTAFLMVDAEESNITNYYNSTDAKSFGDFPFHLMSDYIDVKQGDLLFFGPCVPSQGFQIGVYNDKSTSLGAVYKANDFSVVSTFDNGEVIYNFTIPSGVNCVKAVNNAANDSVYLVTKNQAFDKTSFIEYWTDKSVDVSYYVSGGTHPTAAPDLKNLFDTKNPISGYYDAKGVLTAGGYYTSGFIAVKEGDVVYYGPATVTQTINLAGYDSSKREVTGLLSTRGSAIVEMTDSTVAIFSYKVPVGVAYVAVAVEAGRQTTGLVTLNQPFNSDTHTEYFLDDSSQIIVNKDSVLYGKTALFCGDSICAASTHDKTTLSKTGWSGRIALYYGMTTTNNGRDGASISTCRNENRILNQINSVKNNKYDYVLLHGGVNDAWDSVTIGEMTDSFNVIDFNTRTFAGGLEELFYYATQYFSEDAKIGYIINFQTPNSGFGLTRNMSKYFDVAMKICDKWGIPYLDFYNDANFNNLMKVTTNEYLIDYLHPNTNGYEILYKPIATWMETLSDDDNDNSSEDSSNTSSFNVLLGDVNNDGTINSVDALRTLQSFVGLIDLDEQQLACADVDSNGTVNSADALLILKYSVKLIHEF